MQSSSIFSWTSMRRMLSVGNCRYRLWISRKNKRTSGAFQNSRTATSWLRDYWKTIMSRRSSHSFPTIRTLFGIHQNLSSLARLSSSLSHSCSSWMPPLNWALSVRRSTMACSRSISCPLIFLDSATYPRTSTPVCSQRLKIPQTSLTRVSTSTSSSTKPPSMRTLVVMSMSSTHFSTRPKKKWRFSGLKSSRDSKLPLDSSTPSNTPTPG